MTGLACLLILAHLALTVKPVAGNFRLQILHNNDLHARFVETDTYSASCPDEYVQGNKCFGGFARMKQAADDARLEAKKQNIPTIFLNGGDSFQGTPYYTIYKWQIVAPLIDRLEFDVMALGNHEFDDGIDNLVNYLRNIKTPVVCANLNMTSEKRLDLPILTPSRILDVEGKKIGVVGYLTPDTMEISNTENLQIFPEMSYIRAEARRLKAAGIKIIIALGHSGFDADVKIAKEIEEISIVVGAHSHSLLHTPKDHPPSTEQVTSEYPTTVTQKSGKNVPVVQAYAYSKYLGRLIVEFDDEGNVINASGNTQLLDHQVKKEPGLSAEISKWESNVKAQISTVKGYTRTFLAKPNFNHGELESNLANLITDSFVDIGVQLSQESKLPTWTRAPIAFYQNGGIRTQLDHKKNEGALTLEDLMMVMPFDNKLVEIVLRGSTIRKALEFSVSEYDSKKTDFYARHNLHFSGLKVDYDFTRPAGKRIESVQVLCTDCSIPKFVPLTDDVTYRVITVNFLADGGDKFDMIKDELVGKTILRLADLDALVRYVEKNRIVYPKQDNRITVNGFSLSKSTSSGNSATPTTTWLYLIALLPLLRIWFS